MVEPKIGLSTLYCLSLPFMRMIDSVLKAEITHIEIVDEGLHTLNKRRIALLNELAASYDLEYIVHAPFADINIASPSKPLMKAMLKRLRKSITQASDLNCRKWVFHSGLRTGVSMFYPGNDWRQNLRTIQILDAFAKDHELNVVIENMLEPFPFVMKSVEDFKKFYSEINEDIGLAFDIGHANLNQQIDSFVTHLGDKIVHIHAHDNDGKSDQHLGVCWGTIDWKNVARMLRAISYDGIVVIESLKNTDESIQKLKELLG